MATIDLVGITVAVAAAGLVSAIGIAIDSLLLSRHVKAIDDLSLRWWLFFDGLRIIDIPRIAVDIYIKGKDKVLGKGFTPMFMLRSFFLSLILTIITVPGGRVLGLHLLLECNKRHGFDGDLPLVSQFQAAWGWTGVRAVTYLVPINIAFDLATIFITILILSKALKKPDYFLISLIILDIFACLLLFYNAIYIADRFDNASTISTYGYWTIFPNLISVLNGGCTAYHIVTSKLLFVSTILLPTVIYLIMIIGLFIMRESFKLLKFIAMYILEKSVEDKKTIFAHLGTSVGLVVAVGKAIIEMAKVVTVS